ncbi:hypoxanthine-guanine phosphoribosyltransferase [Candidozyma auris]
MSASPHVSSNLELILKDMIKFILENSMASFLSEVMEMLESILLSTNQMSPTMWELYQTVISCFDTYAEDFFDTFQPFLEGVVLYAFADESITVDNANVQSLFNVCFRMLTGDMVDPVFAHQAFELIEFSILTLHKRFIPFLPQFLPEIFKIYQSLEAQEAFDGYMLHYLRSIGFTIDTVGSQAEKVGTQVVRTQWIDYAQSKVDLVNKNILIIDEVDDTRTTLHYAVSELKKDVAEQAKVKGANPEDTKFGIFVLHDKDKKKKADLPDDIMKTGNYFAARTVPDVWIAYPWESDDIVYHTKRAVEQGNDVFLPSTTE